MPPASSSSLQACATRLPSTASLLPIPMYITHHVSFFFHPLVSTNPTLALPSSSKHPLFNYFIHCLLSCFFHQLPPPTNSLFHSSDTWNSLLYIINWHVIHFIFPLAHSHLHSSSTDFPSTCHSDSPSARHVCTLIARTITNRTCSSIYLFVKQAVNFTLIKMQLSLIHNETIVQKNTYLPQQRRNVSRRDFFVMVNKMSQRRENGLLSN